MRRGIIVAIVVTAIGAAALLSISPGLRGRIFREGPRVGDFVACGAPGQSCCKWPQSSPGLDPRYCTVGAGCDIATNTCVTPCGAGGQVCCDGPDTFAPQGDRSPTGLFCANGNCVPRKQMCTDGACTRETRRCDVQCGKAPGAACCPPDAGIAVASCKGPEMICEFGAQGLQSGTCVHCGDQGQPPCPGDECRPSGGVRTMERGGICVACGVVGQPECPDGRKCDYGAPDPHGPNCIPGGGQDQPCLEGRFCGYDGMFCDGESMCRVCGQAGQPCCPAQPLLNGGVTKECGGWSNLQCANFNGRRVCQYKPGQGPGSGTPPPPPPTQPKTCGGQPYQIGVTTTFAVWVRQYTGCAAIGGTYQANSFAEAVQCARTVYGDTAIAENVEEYTFSMNGPLGCRTVQVYGKDETDASSCAHSLCINCDEPMPGSCP